MAEQLCSLHVNEVRLRERLETLASLARTPEGIYRLAYSDAFHRSNAYIASLMEEAGMEVRTNAVGNMVGVLPGKTSRVILTGSHIDSVRDAGMFDGCLGVIAGIEAAQVLHENGTVPEHTLEVAAFADEEGLVAGGMLGSCAYCGMPPSPTHQTAMETLGISREDYDAARAPAVPDWSLELHIEQGGVLEHHRKDIGIVTAIVAIRRYLVEFSGMANHAGTTPMELRDDALIKAARFVQRVREVVMETHPEMVGTVGRLEVSPGSENTIPGRVRLVLELRSQQEEHVETAYRTLMEEFREDITGCELTLYQGSFPMDKTIRETVRSVCENQGLSAMEMGSGAGHDSMILAQVTRTGMIFVPSVKGISHSPAELTHWKDVRQGAEVLLQTILRLDQTTE